ncbi:hypothetical protein PINS_up021335 [Pythium insidiosum]|nr:hypothetical protein PINS_up021335 [Pythium insidiosum]
MGKKSTNANTNATSATQKAATANANGKSEQKLLSPPSSMASNYSNYGSTSSNKEIMDQVRSAHANQDAEASRHLHQLKIGMGHDGHASENHMSGSEHIKSAVYGGLDGIITTFATVTSVAGSGLPHSVILIIGLAHLVADGSPWGSATCSAVRRRPTS